MPDPELPPRPSQPTPPDEASPEFSDAFVLMVSPKTNFNLAAITTGCFGAEAMF